MHRTISEEYHNVTIDSLSLTILDDLHDSLDYFYTFKAQSAANISGSTAIFSLKMPDMLKSDFYPVEPERHLPVDMTLSFVGLTKMHSVAAITIPENWSLMSKPENVSVKTDNLEYVLHFEVVGNRINVYQGFQEQLQSYFLQRRIQTRDRRSQPGGEIG